MSGWSPPRLPRAWLAVGVVLSLAVLAYAVLVAGQLLLGVFPLILLLTAYFGWRFLHAFEAIADAQQRRAAAAERDADADGAGRGVGRTSPSGE